MSDIGLTQDQIDAMLRGVTTEEPASAGAADAQALADFETETMGNLASVLNAMTGFDYTLAGVEYVQTSPTELAALLADDLVFGFLIKVGQELKHYLILDQVFAKNVAASLMGTETGDDLALSEMELSAIAEVISQANGTYLTNLAAALKQPATGESVTRVDATTAAAEIGEGAMLANLEMSRGNGETVTVRHLIPAALAATIMGKINEHVAPPAPKPVAATPAASPVRQPPAAPAPTPAGQFSGNIAAPTTQFSPAVFSQLDAGGSQLEVRNLDILLDVPLTVTVELGKTHLPIKQILEYGQGSLITLDKLAGEPIDLLVNGKYFAKGEVVVIEENFGVRITSILSPAERIAQLG